MNNFKRFLTESMSDNLFKRLKDKINTMRQTGASMGIMGNVSIFVSQTRKGEIINLTLRTPNTVEEPDKVRKELFQKIIKEYKSLNKKVKADKKNYKIEITL